MISTVKNTILIHIFNSTVLFESFAFYIVKRNSFRGEPQQQLEDGIRTEEGGEKEGGIHHRNWGKKYVAKNSAHGGPCTTDIARLSTLQMFYIFCQT